MITKPCDQCSSPVTRYPSQFRGSVFCSRECRGKSMVRHGADNPAWKGGRYIEPGKGYVLVRMPDHHRARANGYVLEHLVVMERVLGRQLLPGEVVHHKNHDPADNRAENLELFASNAEHLRTEGHHRPKGPPCPCGRPSQARQLCERHYAQYRRTGKIWDLGWDE